MKTRYITKRGITVTVTTSGALLVPAIAEANSLSGIAGNTFRPGQPGFILFQIFLIPIVAWLMQYVLKAINKGAYGDLLSVAAMLICITYIGGLLVNTILIIVGIAGL